MQELQAILFLILYQLCIIITQMNWRIFILLSIFASLTASQISQEKKVIEFTLTPGGKETITVPTVFSGYQKLELTTFHNEKTRKITLPCQIKIKTRAFFKKFGEIHHELAKQVEQDFWQGGNLWDAMEIGERLICVFQNGQAIEYSTKSFETVYMPIEKVRNIKPFEGKEISYGNLVKIVNKGDHILYVSETGCYHINKDGTWSIFEGFNGTSKLTFAKVYNQKLFIAAGDTISIFSVDVTAFILTLQREFTLFFTEANEQISLQIENFEFDAASNTLYVIDQYEGVKYFKPTNSSDKIEVKSLLPAEHCFNFILHNGLLLVSCAQLVIFNASTMKFISRIAYPFHINSIIINDGYLTAFGERQFLCYWIIGQNNGLAKLRLLYRGELPTGQYQSYLYLPKTKIIALISKNGLGYGRIMAQQYSVECSYLDMFGTNKKLDQDIIGVNTANLILYGLCDKLNNTDIHQQCSSTFEIKIRIYDLQNYKFLIFVVLGIAVIVMGAFAIVRIVRLRMRKEKLIYRELAEDTIITEQNDSRIEKEKIIAAEMMKVEEKDQ